MSRGADTSRGAGTNRNATANRDAPDKHRRPAIVLLCLAACLLIYAAQWLSADKIQANRQHQQLALLRSVITQEYDNNPAHDYIELVTVTDLGMANTLTIHHTRSNGVINGFVARPVLARGYNGIIELMIGVTTDGRVTGARILRHQETENLGDLIHQDKSDWLDIFNHRSLQNPPPPQWTKNLDALSGATISSNAVTKAVRSLLQRYQRDPEAFLGP